MADDGGAFLDSLMETNLYSLGAAFQDDHPDLVEAVIEQAVDIEATGLESWAAAQDVPVESAFQTLVTGLALRYYRALSA